MLRTKIAIKVLTSPDLSLFKAHSRCSNQRAIYLNSEIFIEQFYPGLQGSRDQVIFPLVIIGPGARAAHRLTRMAVRSLGTKNWHIKGESIHDPEEEPGRYDKLAENDFAIMAFEGNERPRTVTLTLVSAVEDAELHADIAHRFELSAKHAMLEVPEAAVAHLHASTLGAYPGNRHPLAPFISHDTVEDVLFGNGVPSPSRLFALSPEDLRRRLLAAAETCQRGQELFGNWLTATGHKDGDFKWVSQTHACSAYDYEVYAARWLDDAPQLSVAVKATRASFEQPIHMSIAELHFAAEQENYRIARLYNIDGANPKLQILTGIHAFAAQLIEKLDALPDRVKADSLQLDPGLFEVELKMHLQ